MSKRVVIFVDGDNISSTHASELQRIGTSLGAVTVSRVYGNENALRSWAECHAFEFVYSGSGKNACDLHLAIDLTEFALTQDVDVVLLSTSDSDFVHLARRLRASGIMVVGCGGVQASDKFKAAVSEYRSLTTSDETFCEKKLKPKTSQLDHQIHEAIRAGSMNGRGIRVQRLATVMHAQHGIRISDYPERNWRAYLAKRPELFDLDPRGPEAMVRFVSDAFRANPAALPP